MEQQINFCKTADGVRIAYATVGKAGPRKGSELDVAQQAAFAMAAAHDAGIALPDCEGIVA